MAHPPSEKLLRLLLAFQFAFLVNDRWSLVSGRFIIAGLPEKRFVKLGDINIGFMIAISQYTRTEPCSNKLSMASIHYSQLAEYAVNQINEAKILPHNLTFGVVVLDECYKESIAAAQSLTFVPQTQCQGQETFRNTSQRSDVIDAYDVVAVIGATLSSQSVVAAHVLGPAEIPLDSFYSTSDDLSNKAIYPYFLRTVPPDRFQFEAIFSIIKELGWTYVSVIFIEGSYGENGFKQLRDLFDVSGVCLGFVQKIPTLLTDDEAEAVANNLANYTKARGVIIISTPTSAYKIVKETAKLVGPGTFTWIASDGWGSYITARTDLGSMLYDTFTVSTLTAHVPHYRQYFEQLKLNVTQDPWFSEFWEDLFECSLSDGTCDKNKTVSDSDQRTEINIFSGHLVDTIVMLANATARVLAASPECEGVTGRGARACVTGPRLLSELMATRQNGYTGWLELDANGDRLGRYVIKQVVPDSVNVFDTVVVAEFDSLTRKMTLTNNVTWFYHAPLPGLDHPESKCSHPCAAHEARVIQEVTCCWLCHPCRVNDRLAFNGTRCEACPPFTWPDPDTDKSTCLAIPPDTPRLDSVMGAVQTALAFLCLLVCLLVFIFFHRHRSCRVIKASSRELSFLMLLAIAMGYVVMVTLLAPPTNLTCRLNFLLFCLSFNMLYGSLIVRALRIFRIFEASKRSARRPRFIESGHQIVFSLAFIAVQVVMCVVLIIYYPTWHRLSQSSPQEYYVELSCEFPQAALASFLVFNVLLVAVCTLLAFKTRRLPDNFNESRFISMCVSTKLVVLCCFVPAYLVSQRQLLRMLMLALALALNHSVALVFLFLPKIYAVCYLEGAGDPAATAAQVAPGSSTGGPRSSFAATSQVTSSTADCSRGWGGGGELDTNGVNVAVTTGSQRKVTMLQVRPATISSIEI